MVKLFLMQELSEKFIFLHLRSKLRVLEELQVMKRVRVAWRQRQNGVRPNQTSQKSKCDRCGAYWMNLA